MVLEKKYNINMRKLSKSHLAVFLLFVLWGASSLQAQTVGPLLRFTNIARAGFPPEGFLGVVAPKPVLPPLLPMANMAEIVPPLRPGVKVADPVCPVITPVKVSSNFAHISASVQAAALASKTMPSSVEGGQFFPGKQDIDAVIFDMDGTLLDSLPAWEHSASNFVRSQGIEPEPSLDDEMSKLSLTDGARILKERYGFDLSEEEILRLTLAPIRQHYLTDIQAKPGVPLLLKRLKAQGIKVCVATASDKELSEKVFKRLGLTPYIDFIITCDEVGAGKHSPAVYDVARERLGTTKARTLVVEDALYALQTAKAAGYLTAGVAEPFHPAPHARAIRNAGNYFIYTFSGPGVVKNF